jgi:hypothetical protein
MNFRQNKPLRNFGIYKLQDRTLILLYRSDVLSFLFSTENWYHHGPVDYRISHGSIYQHGELTKFIDEDLKDTGLTANPPSLTSLLGNAV